MANQLQINAKTRYCERTWLSPNHYSGTSNVSLVTLLGWEGPNTAEAQKPITPLWKEMREMYFGLIIILITLPASQKSPTSINATCLLSYFVGSEKLTVSLYFISLFILYQYFISLRFSPTVKFEIDVFL